MSTDNKRITEAQVIHYATFLHEKSCKHVMVFQLPPHYDYADYAIIATTLSEVHRRGILEDMPSFFRSQELFDYERYCLNRNQASAMGDWVLVDLSDLIIHLMSDDMRAFYELEKLWFENKVVYSSQD